jgi:hypothetical protein
MDMYESNIASYQSLKLQARRDIIEILCFVPVWNDTTWINKSLTIDVQGNSLKFMHLFTLTKYFIETKRPIFAHPEAEILQWALNSTEKVIDCRVTGAPSPAVRWKKNNKVSNKKSFILNSREYCHQFNNNCRQSFTTTT